MKNKCYIWFVIALTVCVSVSPNWCDGEWIKMNTGTSAHYTGIWGSSPEDIFAVGYEGTIIHYDGNHWSTMTSGMSEQLRSVWGSSANDVFAVGYTGIIIHYDGNQWSTMINRIILDNMLYGSLQCVWGSSANNVFAVGHHGTIMHFDGNHWSAMDSGIPQYVNYRGVWGSAANDVFAVGTHGTISHYDGTDWRTMSSGGTDAFAGVWGSSANDVFAVGYSGIIMHYDGDHWSAMDSGINRLICDIYGISANDIFAVGFGGQILHYDGSNWRIDGEIKDVIDGVWYTASEIFIAGSYGAIYCIPHYKDIVLEDENGDRFYFKLGNSQNQAYSFYYGKWATNGALYDCTLLYDKTNKTIIINTDYKDSQICYYTLKYNSPNFYNGRYTLYNSNAPFTETFMRVIEGEFPFASAAKVSERNKTAPQQDNTLKLGVLIPMSGELQSLGSAFYSTLLLAQQDANTYLQETGSELTVELFTEDNQANPGQTWHAVQSMREQGVSIFLGPQDSPSLDYMKQFADEEDYLLLSSASTAPQISIADDNVMRCISDDNLQAAALIDKLKSDGIEDIVIVSRTNIYGRGLYQALERGWMEGNEYPEDIFDELTGEIIENATDTNTAVTVLFSRPETDIPDALGYLQNILSEDTFADKSKSAVVLVAYDEGADLMQQAAQIPGLDELRWYGTDSLAQNNAVIGNPAAAEFAAKTNFTCTTFAIPESEAYNNAAAQIESMLGSTPPSLALIAYDAYQLAIRAYLEAGSDDPESMKAALEIVAETYEGLTGDLRFNQNGDRANGAYEYWTLIEEDGLYNWQSEDGQIWTGDPVPVMDWMMME